MFHTLNGATFKQVDQNSKPAGVQLPMGKTTRFCGARARSNTGCLTCRKRKKKCDEVHPICGTCKTRDEPCNWPMKEDKNNPLSKVSKSRSTSKQAHVVLRSPSSSSSSIPLAKQTSHGASISLSDATKSSPASLISSAGEAWAESGISELAPSSREKMKIDFFDNAPEDFRAHEVVQELEGFREDLTNFQMELEQSRLSSAGVAGSDVYSQDFTGVFIPTEFLAGFGFPYLFNLDKDGMVFLECYREQYSTFVSIGLDSSNYFLKTFLSIAASNEGITYAITAWGGFFLELRKPRSDFTKPWEYMQKATRCLCKQMGDYLKPKDKHEFFVLFAFYLIFIGIEVCTGDVRNWRGFMNQCSLLIQSYGGIMNVTDLFGYSNDIKWLISDFKFHDLLSSKCLIDGPIFPIEDYERALAPRPEYGIDPLQGIVGPLYDIMGSMGKARAELRQKWAGLQDQAHSEDSRLQESTRKYFENAQRIIDDFDRKIADCSPSPVHLELLKENEDDRDLHVALFELYKHVCNIQLSTTLRAIPPNSATQQHLLHQALQKLDLLQPTKFKVSLSLALMICGMTCCAAHDRASMTRRFRSHSNQYEIGNLQRVEETVVEMWECNPNGALCIDWAEFVRDKEWHLYVG